MTRKKSYPYKFSFVIPIYNVEAYLEETLESILAQTMSFKENCQIVLVNDGSPDNSEAICLKYKDLYPENIKYVKKKNGGLSAARNTGIEHVEGKYVGFIDPDDIYSSDVIEKVFEFFEQHYDKIDFVALKLKLFEGRTGDHVLNDRFEKSQIINVEEESETIHVHAASIFVKNEALERGHRFDPRLRKFAEDLKFTTMLVLDNMAYGVVKGPVYFYRKRDAGGSIQDGERLSKVWYIEIPHLVYQELFDESEEKFGHIPKYVQSIVMHDIQWRLRQESQSVLTKAEEDSYKAHLMSLINRIDDDVILARRFMPHMYKIFALNKKYGEDIVKKAAFRPNNETPGYGQYFYKGNSVYDQFGAPASIQLEFIEIKDNKLIVEGYFTGFIFKGAHLSVVFENGEEQKIAVKPSTFHKRVFLGDLVNAYPAFKVEIPVQLREKLRFYLVSDKDHRIQLPLFPRRHAGLNNNSSFAYLKLGDQILTRKKATLAIYDYTRLRVFWSEIRYSVALLRRLKLSLAARQLTDTYIKADKDRTPYRGENIRTFFRNHKAILVPAKSTLTNLKTIFMRVAYFTAKSFSHKNIWIISDRINAGGDNGEALFRYASRQDKDAKIYFAISKKSKDFERMKQYGPVVDRNSLRYKILFMLSSKIISSHADDFVINPFSGKVFDYVDLFKFDFVFLQHGVTQGDLSSWLGRRQKNIKLFVAAARPEHQSIIKLYNYEYTDKEVKLTGFPRYDLLSNAPQKKLVLAPTWRKNLVDNDAGQSGIRQYSKDFKNFDYYKFYQGIMEDERINKALEKAGFTGELYLHPSFSSQISDFKETAAFRIKDMPYDYKTAFSEGSILITDYSSVAFDFAYLKKPVIYTQFDKENFFQGHLYSEGYFSYEKHGFGPVVYSYEDAVKSVVSLIRSNAKMEAKYVKRVEKFFYKFDTKNSERVYKAISAINSKD